MYIPSFYISVISYDILERKGWDQKIKDQQVEVDKEYYYQTLKYFNIQTLKYNPISTITNLAEKQASFETFPVRKSSEPQLLTEVDIPTAYTIFGYINLEALKHLHKSYSGIRVTSREYDPNCQICRLGNTKQKVSRLPRVYKYQLFYNLFQDNISQYRSGYSETKVSHLQYLFLSFHFVYTLYSSITAEILWTFKYTINYIKRQYGINIAVLNVDREPTLHESNEFQEQKADTGILVKISVPKSYEQNRAIERSGSILSLQATKIRLEGQLPEELWNEIYPVARYILNRTPYKRHNWLSLLAKLYEQLGQEPLQKYHYLKPYSCKAYTYIYNRPKLEKISIKSYIRYLIGYESTNIWRIQIPSLGRIIVIRDVTFDTTQ